MHEDRTWCVTKVETPEELAQKLTEYSWCCCNGFELDGYLWLNDATGADGAQEYAAVRKPTADDPHYRQVETITASWCSKAEMLRYIHDVQHGTASAAIDSGVVLVAKSAAELFSALGCGQQSKSPVVQPRIETPEQHKRCHHCA